MIKSKAVALALLLLAFAGCAAEDTPTSVAPVTPEQAAAAEQAKACTQTGIVARAKQGLDYVDTWFSKDVVVLWGDPVNVNRATLDASCNYPASATWSTIQDATSLSCTLFGQVRSLRPSFRCVGFGVVVSIVDHNGFTGAGVFLVSDFGVELGAAGVETLAQVERWERELAPARVAALELGAGRHIALVHQAIGAKRLEVEAARARILARLGRRR